MKKLYFTLIILCNTNVFFAQTIGDRLPYDSTGYYRDSSSLAIKEKSFFLNKDSSDFIRFLKYYLTGQKASPKITDSLEKLRFIEIAKTNFTSDSTDGIAFYLDHYKMGGLLLEYCNFKNSLYIRKERKDKDDSPYNSTLNIQHSKLKNLNIAELKGLFRLWDNKIEGDVSFNRSEIDFMGISTKLSEARKFFVNECIVNGFHYYMNPSSPLIVNFSNDTINSGFEIKNNVNDPDSLISKYDNNIKKIVFEDCYIDCFIHVNNLENVSIYFKNCKFGLNCRLYDVNADTLYFEDCLKFEKIIRLNKSTINPCYLFFTNSDIDKIIFDYTENYIVGAPKEAYATNESYLLVYKLLVDKFTREGRNLSLRKVDTEFKDYKYRVLYDGGGLLSFIERAWWEYGYAPQRAIYWSFLILFLFFLFNLKFWSQMRQVYNIISQDKDSFYDKLNKKDYLVKKSIIVFLFTGFIFFSFYINLSKLSFLKTRWLVIFFIQYLIGLYCLFFIVNAILKF